MASQKFRIIIFTLLLNLFTFSHTILGQELGVSFSYFLPKDGYFSIPISPFSLRGIGFDLTSFLAVETGFTLYRMSGLNVKGLPFESKKPLIGPNFTLLIPFEGVIGLAGENTELRIKGGGFIFFPFGNKIIEGNMDRALVESIPGLEVVNSNLIAKNKLGAGIQFGVEFVMYFAKQFGVSIGGNYFIGDSELELTGSYTGANSTGVQPPVQVDYPESRLDFTGFEISLGIIFNTK